MRRTKDEVEDDLIEEFEEPATGASFNGDFEVLSDEDLEPSDRRRDPLRKHIGFDSTE